ncbi:MAG TPA: hypothetical protein PK878_17020 [bacterium]|nr:hypothetical protein [Candidatus Omnitrophota bacterium]HOJ61987.1 hypothetical protein [bacterium]HOL96136.1 hypothetical protein [bacterium]HXK93017.1 hypothetical protein [bacterium]
MGFLSALYSLAVALELISLALLLLFLRNCWRRVKRHPETGERLRRRKMGRDTVLGLTTLIFFFAGMTFMNLALFLQSYRTYVVGHPIASVAVERQDGDGGFYLRVKELGTPLSHTVQPFEQEYHLKGERWMLEGHLIRFHPLLSFFGFKPVYQLTRIQGSYYSIDEERTKERTVYPLVDRADEQWWRWIYKNRKSIPLLDMVSGSAVSQDAEEGSKYVVTVVPTGFTLQPAAE